MKIFFLYPNTYGNFILPPAIALFSSILKNAGHQVQLFDLTYYALDDFADSDGTKAENLNVLPYDLGSRGISLKPTNWEDDLRNAYDDFKPDLIAISATESMWSLAEAMLNQLDSRLKRDSMPVIVGGVFPTFAPQLAIRHPAIDMICVGEGDQAMPELCARLEAGKSYDDIRNLWVKMPNGEIKKNQIGNAVNMDDNPILDVLLFDEDRLYRPMAGQVYKMLPIETHRGCPYKCTFCNSPDMARLYNDETESRFFRKRSFDRVHEELSYYKEHHEIEYFYFSADTFLAYNKRELDGFCEMYKDIGLPFWIQTRPETITREKLRQLQDVGLNRISFGVEHGNEKFRNEVLTRGLTNQEIVERLNIPAEMGIEFSVNNITGFPTETRELAQDTIRLNKLVRADNFNMFVFTPFHGTPLRKKCEEMGLIDSETMAPLFQEGSILDIPGYPRQDIDGLMRCFVLYVAFPEDRWDEVRRAEADTPEGKKIFDALRLEYNETFGSGAAPVVPAWVDHQNEMDAQLT